VKAKEACDVIRRGDSHIKKNAPVEPQLSFVIVASGTPCAMRHAADATFSANHE
jgi:hypothetical protein